MTTNLPTTDDKLTPKQERFARCIAEGMTGADAYRTAYDVASTTALGTVHGRAYDLVHSPKVAARIQQHRQQIAAAFVITEAELRKDLHDLVNTDPTELSGVWVGCCRHCYGASGAPQWIDHVEFAEAVAQAADKNAALPGSARAPMFGGIGFDKRKPPVEGCRECNGYGVPHPFVRDTRNLSATARKLYKGTKVNKRDGTIDLLTHDQTTLRDQLNKSVGLYKSVSLNLNADVPAGLEHASVNDMLDILRTLSPVAPPAADAMVVAVQDAPPADVPAPVDVTQPPLPEPKPWDAHRRKPNRLPIVITPDGGAQ